MLPGGHQIVAGAFGGGSGEDGGGDLQKTVLLHGLTESGYHIAAQQNVLLDGRVPQVQIAVFQTGGLIGLPAAVDLKGQLVIAAAAQNFHGSGNHLDIAGGLLGVLGIPLPDDAGDGHGGFLVDGLEALHQLFVFNDGLGGAVEITNDGEAQLLTYHTQVFQPANQCDGLSHLLDSQLTAVMCTHLCHDLCSLLFLNRSICFL